MQSLLKKLNTEISVRRYHAWIFGILFAGVVVTAIVSVVLAYAYFLGIPRAKLVTEIPAPIRSIVDDVRDLPFSLYIFRSSDLTKYDLQISDKDLAKLSLALPTNPSEFLTSANREKVDAIFIADSLPRQVRVGYRGDKWRHWFNDKKSWTIRFKSDDLLNDQSEIKLIVPFDRLYIGEFFNGYRASKLGLPVPKDEMVLLSINNGPNALYYQQEGWTTDYLEKSFGTSNGNLYGEKNLEDKIFTSSFFWKKYISIQGEEDDFSDLDYLLNLINNSSDAEFKENIDDVLDIDTFINWMLHSILSGSTHQGDIHNARLFFNNELKKFFMIPWDVSLTLYSSLFQLPEFTNNPEFYDIDYDYNPLVTRVLNISEYRDERNKRLWEYVSDDYNLTEDLSFYDKTYDEVKSSLFNDSLKLWRNEVAENDIMRTRSIIKQNFYFLKQQLSRATLGLTVTQELDLSLVPVVMELSHQSASGIMVHGVTLTGQLSNPSLELSMYADVNEDGLLDSGDQFIAKLKQNGDTYYNSDVGIVLNSDREVSGSTGPVKVNVTKTKFLFTTSSLATFDIETVNIQTYNSVTGVLIEPIIHVQSSRI
ncbi:MAG: spore coat protein H [Candidatus Paceibacteria bacterium]|jgi:spore coat protein H